MLKLCSHPLLVLGDKLPDSIDFLLSETLPGVSDIIAELHKPYNSPKLVALQEILEECGIGVDASGSEGAVGVGQHRVLIFAQHKVMFILCCLVHFRKLMHTLLSWPIMFGWPLMQAFLDLIERDLFHTHMKRLVS